MLIHVILLYSCMTEVVFCEVVEKKKKSTEKKSATDVASLCRKCDLKNNYNRKLP